MADVTGGTSPKADPFLTFMFSIQATVSLDSGDTELDGYFTDISGLGDENDMVEFKANTNDGHETTILLPGRNETSEITLKRGITKDMTFWQWRQLVRDGKIDQARTNVTITMYNRRYEAMVQWDMTDAWPSKITGPDFQAGNSEFGVEEITLVYHNLSFDESPTTTT